MSAVILLASVSVELFYAFSLICDAFSQWKTHNPSSGWTQNQSEDSALEVRYRWCLIPVAAATMPVIVWNTDRTRAHMGAHVLALMQECTCTMRQNRAQTYVPVCVCPSVCEAPIHHREPVSLSLRPRGGRGQLAFLRSRAGGALLEHSLAL